MAAEAAEGKKSILGRSGFPPLLLLLPSQGPGSSWVVSIHFVIGTNTFDNFGQIHFTMRTNMKILWQTADGRLGRGSSVHSVEVTTGAS